MGRPLPRRTESDRRAARPGANPQKGSREMTRDAHPYHMGQMSDAERIATLEANERNMARDLAAIRKSLDEVVKTLNEMSGGKKAVLGIFALVGSFLGACAALVGMHIFGK